jgi:hypothetical protein
MMGWGYGPDWRRQWGWRRGFMGRPRHDGPRR